MKAKVKHRFGTYVVEVTQGHQSFFVNDCEGTTKSEAKWFAKMFRKALKRHDAEQAKKRK